MRWMKKFIDVTEEMVDWIRCPDCKKIIFRVEDFLSGTDCYAFCERCNKVWKVYEHKENKDG